MRQGCLDLANAVRAALCNKETNNRYCCRMDVGGNCAWLHIWFHPDGGRVNLPVNTCLCTRTKRLHPVCNMP